MNWLEKIDYYAAQNSNIFLRFTENFFTNFLAFFTRLGNTGILFVLITAILLFFKSTRKRGFKLFIALAIVAFLTLLIKIIVRRDRPFRLENSMFYEWWIDAGSLYVSGYSFPSGHTSASMVLGVILFYTGNMKKSWLYLIIPIIFGFSRIYFMVHYFSDVLAGALLGVISSIIALQIINLMDIKMEYVLLNYTSNKLFD